MAHFIDFPNDLISRSALLVAYDKAHKGPPGGARKLIEEAPEGVIRCENCKNWNERRRWCDICEGRNGLYPVTRNWFCADGQRKET